MDPVSLDTLKSELCPRISAEDLLELIDRDQAALRANQSRAKPKLFIIDVRPADEYPFKISKVDQSVIILA